MASESETAALSGANGGYWGEHPMHPRSDWKHEVANNDTGHGYWSWVAARISDAS
ncbi:hypothetical protein [Mycolicibacterium sp.]|uniref:hypothetical protein n=1 Tax=Mycolicibacterium sp. TaxID=2320850 RepID=UPI0035605739